LKMNPSRIAIQRLDGFEHFHPFVALGCLKSTRQVHSGPALFVVRES
jgi:hypothetical protein